MRDGGAVHLEEGFSRETLRELSHLGHRIQQNAGAFGGYQAIRVDEHGTFYGASESRKDGHAAGY